MDDQERVAQAMWQRRLDNDDPNTHSLTWEEASQSPFIAVAYEVQEIRRDAETAIAEIERMRAKESK
jgi:hypothetical protein